MTRVILEVKYPETESSSGEHKIFTLETNAWGCTTNDIVNMMAGVLLAADHKLENIIEAMEDYAIENGAEEFKEE